MLQIAKHILDTKLADFDPAWLEDRYRTVLADMLREKKAQVPARSTPAASSPQNVINLMDALKRSLADAKPAAQSVRKRMPRDTVKSSPSTRSSGTRARRRA
jgi:DNA end-binding protein Ku